MASSSSFSSSRQKCHQISLDEIKDATDNFDERNVLGQGGEGKVYLAAIKLGWKKTEVAVKHLKPNSEEFEKEINIVSNIQHPNLVSLLGYCDESGQKILLYEFMEKGSLSSYLKKKSSTATSLSWQQRLRICLDAARGLQHLHAETNEFPKGIIHRDVKPDNILLDHNWVAKISDFGMFKLSHVDQMQSTMITNLKGTGGYYAPEYVMYRSITRKIDVYAFGVVLFQVLCLKMPWDRGDESYYCSDDEDLGFWCQQNVESRIKEEISDDSLKAFTAVVGKSLKRDPKKRPTMGEVVLDLEIALNCQKHEDEAKQLRAAARESDEQSTGFRPSILSAEFVRVSIHDAGDMDAVILLKSKAWATLPRNGEDEDVKLHEEDTTNVRDRLLPLIIDLLKTENLPAVLRIYRNTLTADMKAAIKTVVAELLPVLVGRPSESEIMPGERIVDADGGGSSLASKLRSLSSESFVQLMSTIFKIVQAHLVRAAEVKKAIEWIMSNLDGHYAADSVAVAIAQGALAAETAMESDGQIRADVLRENTEAVFSACDVAHGRWAKLLGVRAILHPRLKLQEFLHIYNISQEFIAATEKIGGRLGHSIRGTLQSQAKSFVDFQHESRMTKIKVVLDHETWVEVDVPTEFQAIVTSLFFSEPLVSGDSNDYSGELQTGYHDVVNINDTSSPIAESSVVLSSQRHILDRSSKSNETSADSSPLLVFKGVGYHMVNCGLILLKILSEYIDMNTLLPALSSEVIHRVAEILKFFNTRICELVLGAGAMQVSGLKSITSKHLAMASQLISFMHDIIPEIRRVLFLKVPETRKALLLSEIEQVSQDFKVHRDEIHTKLVQIMRERLLFHLRGLPQIVESWNRPDDFDAQPSQFARSLTKEVGYLQRVLSRTLQEVDVQEIFREIVIIFHLQISEAFSLVEISTPQAKERLYRDVQHILGCIKSLPSVSPGNSDKPQNWGQLDELLAHRFSNEAGQ